MYKLVPDQAPPGSSLPLLPSVSQTPPAAPAPNSGRTKGTQWQGTRWTSKNIPTCTVESQSGAMPGCKQVWVIVSYVYDNVLRAVFQCIVCVQCTYMHMYISLNIYIYIFRERDIYRYIASIPASQPVGMRPYCTSQAKHVQMAELLVFPVFSSCLLIVNTSIG